MIDDSVPPPPKNCQFSVDFSHALFPVVDFFTLKVGLMDCPKMSVMNYHSVLSNIPQERRSYIIMRQCRLGMVQFRAVWFGAVHFSARMQIFDDLTYLSAKFQEKPSYCI
jgi:hypothetical protein